MARTAREFLSELDEEIRRDTAQRPVKHVVTADEILNRYNFETTFADKLKKVGFFGQDGSTQTDSSEIMPMNELADALRTLMDEFVTLKRDFTLTKGALLSGLDEKLRSKATELYCRINTKMEEMEQMHIDRVSVVRAAFRQQLADILAAIRSQFVDIVEEQLRLGRAKMQMIIDAKEDKIKELQAVVQRQASMIELLKKQLAETQKQLQAVLEELTSARMVEVHRTPPPVARDPTPVKPLTPPPPPPPLITEEELQALRNELARLQDELRELRSEMTKKSANADSLGRELNALKEALEKERAANQDLHGENDVLRAQLESSAENYRLLWRRVTLTPEQASDFYAEHFGKMFFPSLVAYMSSGPISVFAIAKEHGIKTWREMIGPTNALKAKQDAPNSLRAIYGADDQRNGLHGSHDEQAASREIRFFFADSQFEPTDSEAVRDFLAKKVNITLIRGLTELCKQKPSDPILWLADWLIANNPNKPKVSG